MMTGKTINLQELPGEVRNNIFEICIADAFSRAKPAPKRLIFGELSYGAKHAPTPPRSFKVTVLPQWSGSGLMRTDSIASLPLLFVNKQLFNEVSSLVYSKVEEVIIGPYTLQYGNEDPNVRWDYAYRLLNTRPHLLNHIKTLTIHLPYLRHELVCTYWKNWGVKWKGERVPIACCVVPGLVTFLRTLKSLSCVNVTLAMDMNDPPIMEPLLQLYDLDRVQVVVKIVDSYHKVSLNQLPSENLPKWVTTWDDCLLRSGRNIESLQEV